MFGTVKREVAGVPRSGHRRAADFGKQFIRKLFLAFYGVRACRTKRRDRKENA